MLSQNYVNFHELVHHTLYTLNKKDMFYESGVKGTFVRLGRWVGRVENSKVEVPFPTPTYHGVLRKVETLR